METAELESATQKSLLPNLYCVKCDEKCVPRDMSVMRANEHEAFPYQEFGTIQNPGLPSRHAQRRRAGSVFEVINDTEWYEQQRTARREALKHYVSGFTRALYSNQRDDASMPQCSSD